jgi:hypothetical protein
VQVVKVSVTDQNSVDGGQVPDAQSRHAQTLEHEQPTGKIGIDENSAAADLQEKAGVPYEGDPQLMPPGQHGVVRFAGAPLHRRLADQSAELLSALPKVLIDHLA